MSIWAEVKKALNSTVGTTKFKPLNELYLDSRYIYASDHTIVHTIPEAGSDNKYYTYFKINIHGSYRAKVEINGHSNYKLDAYLYVMKGDTLISQKTIKGIAINQDTTISCDFNANAGDIINVYTITYQAGGGGNAMYSRANWKELCGTIGVGGIPAEIYTE